MLPVPKTKPGFHSERSPSTAHRWRLCPGSVEESRGLPDDVGEEAIQGTVFHDYAADCLEIGLSPFSFVGDRLYVEEAKGYREFTKEMAAKMLSGLDYVWAMADAPGAELHVEERVNLENWIGPDESGTADAFVIDVLNWRLVTFDWKWGAGVPVSPDWNDQAMLYTLGVWDTFAEDRFVEGADGRDLGDIEVVIIIEQPRAPGGGGTWTTTLSQLLAEGRAIRRDADKTLEPGAPRIPGEKQCQFCRAAAHNTCKARSEMIMGLLGIEPDDLEVDLDLGTTTYLKDRRALTPEQRSQIVLSDKLIKNWLKALHEEAMIDAQKGNPVPGLKRVLGRAPARAWEDEKRAAIMLEHDFGDDAYKKNILSPAQVEDEIGKKAYRERYEGNVDKGDAKPILVSEADPRTAIKSDLDLLDEILDEPDETESLI